MSTLLPAHLQSIETELEKMARTRAIYTTLLIAITAIVVVAGVNLANIANASPFSQGFPKLLDYPIDMLSMAWNIGWNWWSLPPKHFGELLDTINMALFSTFVGFLLAIVLACLASKNIMPSTFVVLTTRRILDIARSFPELVIASVLIFLMGKNVLPAVIAITIHTAGALGKLFSEAIENIDVKPVDGLKSVGASWTQRVWFAVFPQVMPLFLSYALLRLEINVRASTILGFVGAGGIGEALNVTVQLRDGGDMIAIMMLLVVTIIALDYLSTYLRGVLIGGDQR